MPHTAPHRTDYWILTGLIGLLGLVLGTVLPVSALQLERQGHASGLIGLILALHALGQVMALPLTTWSVQRWGGRRALQAAGLGAALACALMQQASTPWHMGLGLTLLGVLVGLVFNLVETWVNQVVSDAERGQWLAIHCTFFTLCQVCGPLCVQALPPAHVYEVCGLVFLLGLPCAAWLSRRDLVEADADAVPDDTPWWRVVLSAPAIVWSTVLFALFDVLVLGMLPLYGRLQGLSEAQALASASVVLAGDTALEWVVGKLADRFGRRRLHTLCAALLLLSTPLLPLAIGTWWWWPLLFAMGGMAGGIYVMSLMACGQRFSGRGLLRVTALLGASWGVASGVGPLLTGALMQVNVSWALPCVLCAVTLILLWALALEKP